jgi:hypothetical protein
MNNGRSILFTFIPFAVILLIVLLFLPLITVEVAPESKIQVVDCKDRAVSKILVTQVWQHLRYEKETNVEEQKTNLDGVIVFPKREISISISKFFLGKIFGKSSMNHIAEDKETHYSFGIENETAQYLKSGEINKLILCDK